MVADAQIAKKERVLMFSILTGKFHTAVNVYLCHRQFN